MWLRYFSTQKKGEGFTAKYEGNILILYITPTLSSPHLSLSLYQCFSLTTA